MTEYVLGFLFSNAPEFSRVVLIRKKKPEWQAGKLNGVGGKVEKGETALDAMRREFLEECGVKKENWVPFALLDYPDARVWCFAAEDGMLLDGAVRTMTDEEVVVCPSMSPWRLKGRLPNLSYLIPMAMEALSVEKPEVLVIQPLEFA